MFKEILFTLIACCMLAEVHSIHQIFSIAGYAIPDGVSPTNPLAMVQALQSTLQSHYDMIPTNMRTEPYMQAKQMFDIAANRATNYANSLNSLPNPINSFNTIRNPVNNLNGLPNPVTNLNTLPNPVNNLNVLPNLSNVNGLPTLNNNLNTVPKPVNNLNRLPNLNNNLNTPSNLNNNLNTLPQPINNLNGLPNLTNNLNGLPNLTNNLNGFPNLNNLNTLPNPANAIAGNIPSWLNSLPLPLRQLINMVRYVRRHCPLCCMIDRAMSAGNIPADSYAVDASGNIFREQGTNLIPSNYAINGQSLVDMAGTTIITIQQQ